MNGQGFWYGNYPHPCTITHTLRGRDFVGGRDFEIAKQKHLSLGFSELDNPEQGACVRQDIRSRIVTAAAHLVEYICTSSVVAYENVYKD